MSRRLLLGLLTLASLVCAQRRVDPRNTYDRVIAVVPFTGKGTTADPKRPEYAPWPLPQAPIAAVTAASQPPTGIVAFFFEPTDDGKSAVVEFVARSHAAFAAILADKTIQAFEKGRVSKTAIEAAIQTRRKDFNLDKFGLVMP